MRTPGSQGCHRANRENAMWEPSEEQNVRAICCWLVGMLLFAVATRAAEPVQPKGSIRVAAVITPESSGLLRELLADFEKQTGYTVTVDSRQDVYGLARDGKADLVLSHYGHGGTEEFCAEGLGGW